MDLKVIRDNPKRKREAIRALPYIVERIKNNQYEIDDYLGFKTLKIDGIAILSLTPYDFVGYFKLYYTAEQLTLILSYIKGRNRGHRFEELTAHSLILSGHSIEGIKYSNLFTKLELSIIEVLVSIFKEMPKETLRKVKDYENKKSLSGDFIGEKLSISCKRGVNAIKHPKMNSGFSILLGHTLNDKITLPFGESFMNDYLSIKEFRELSGDTGDKTIAKQINKETYSLLDLDQYPNLIKFYNFLMGSDRPIIITLNDKKITMTHLGKIKDPTSMKIKLDGSRIVVEFDNGIILKRRVKTAINSKSRKKWNDAYKSEWTLVKTPVIVKNTKTFQIP